MKGSRMASPCWAQRGHTLQRGRDPTALHMPWAAGQGRAEGNKPRDQSEIPRDLGMHPEQLAVQSPQGINVALKH